MLRLKTKRQGKDKIGRKEKGRGDSVERKREFRGSIRQR